MARKVRCGAVFGAALVAGGWLLFVVALALTGTPWAPAILAVIARALP